MKPRKKILNFRPAVFFPLSFAAGIAAFFAYERSLPILGVLALLLPLILGGLTLAFGDTPISKTLVFTALFELAAIAGAVNVALRFENFFGADINGSCFVTAEAEREEFTPGGHKIYFTDATVSLGAKKYRGQNLVIYADPDARVVMGEVISFTAELETSPLYSRGNVNLNSFIFGTRFTGYSDLLEYERVPSGGNLFSKCRRALIKTIKRGMKEDNAAIAAAMLFGDKTEVPADTLVNMRYAGVAHLFAVSGLHVGFVSGAVFWVMRKLKINRYAAFIVTFAFAFFYCGICGFSPSATRALIMISLYMLFRTFGLKYDMPNSIALSAFIVLLISPQSLGSYGFLLSYTAVISICVLSGPIKRMLGNIPLKLEGPVSNTIAAQLGTTPLGCMFFGYASWISAFVNLLLMPIIAVLFAILFVCVILAWITTLSGVFLFVPDALIGIMKDFFGGVDYAYFTVSERIPAISTAIYFAGMLFSADMINISWKIKLPVFAACVGAAMVFSRLFAVGLL